MPQTRKVHAVFHHIEDFCDDKQLGLGFCSEQAMESVHFDFNNLWSKYCVSENHSSYGQRLYDAVVAYNSHHL